MKLPVFDSVEDAVRALRPSDPVYCLRTGVLAANARRFIELFPGRVLYAVKCNPQPAVLDRLYAAGIRHFDAASLPEIAQIAERYPDATAYYMHPVKSRPSLRTAYAVYGVRHFVIDDAAELDKLLHEIPTRDYCVLVRLRTASTSDSVYDLASKFGCEPSAAGGLLRRVATAGCRPGLAFHVGSQCRNPRAYRDGLALVADTIRLAGVCPEIVDVGGGFPVRYGAADIPSLEAFIAAIEEGAALLQSCANVQLMCEPGRALVADACSLLVQVWLRKDDRLYLNDGIFGSLAEMFLSSLRMPVRLVGRVASPAGAMRAFRLYGPTCDSVDVVPGTVALPADVQEGDWLEVSQLGAYAQALASRFNGFHPRTLVEVRG